jgi:hypothetical protein
MKLSYTSPLSTLLLFMLLGSCSNPIGERILQQFKDIEPARFESDVKEFDFADSNPEKIRISNWNRIFNLTLSDLLESIEYVRLDNSPEAIIGEINKIIVQDSFIYVWRAKAIRKFTLNGDYVATIGSRGPGPMEYNEPTDFVIFGDEIIVSDQFKFDLKYYDLDGNFKRAEKTPFAFLQFAQLSPNQYLFHQISTGNNNHLQSIANWLVFETDTAFQINHRGFFRPAAKNDNFIRDGGFYPYPDKVFFQPIYNDTIFSISPDNNIRAEYIFDFGDGKMPEKYLLQRNRKARQNAMNTGVFPFMWSFVPTEDYLYFRYTASGTITHAVYSKKQRI